MKSTYLLIFLLTIGFVQQANAHSEIVAKLIIEHAENGLTITASFEKGNLAHALKKEAECVPKDMLNICAHQYIQEHIQFLVNGKKMKLTKLDQQLTKNSVLVSYRISFEAPIKKLSIVSDYLLKYNDHAKLNVVSKLSHNKILYSLSARRKMINISI